MRCAYICLLLGVASTCDAQLILQPEGLERGDQYRLIFTTSQKRDATSSNIEDYNNFVQSVAESSPEAAMWGLDWKAIVSTPTVDAVDNTGTDWRVDDGVPIYRVDGEQIAIDNHGLWLFEAGDTPFSVFLDIDERGSMILADLDDDLPIYTGTNAAGLKSPIGLEESLRGLGGSSFGRTGSAFGVSPDTRFDIDGFGVALPLRFYALSEAVTAVPEPNSSTTLAAICVFVLVANRRY